jgi:hypothetical protein
MKIINMLKENINNIHILIQDRNYKPFWRPILVIIVVFVLINLWNSSAQDQVAEVKRKIEAQQAEFENEKEYKAAKTKYQNLLAQLPPVAQKNEWILLQVESIVNLRGLRGSVNYVKGPSSTFGILEISTAVITGKLNYKQIGLLVESIENNPQFLRISNISLERQDSALGQIKVKIDVYTAFLEEHKVLSKTSGRN